MGTSTTNVHKSNPSSKKSATPRPVKSANVRQLHPILALQQTIGNQAVTSLLESHQHPGPSGDRPAIYRDDTGPPAAEAPVATKPMNVNITIGPDSAVVFKSESVTLGGIKVHITGRMSIKGKASLIGETLPKKGASKALKERVRALVKDTFEKVKPTGSATKIEAGLGGETLTLELEPGAEKFPAFQVSGRFSAGKRSITVAGCEVKSASVTLDATVWIAPTSAAKLGDVAGDASVKGYDFAGSKARFTGDDKRTAGVSQKTAMDDFEARVPAFVKGQGFLKLPEQRATFFQQMRSYFGTDKNTIDHFAKMRKVNVVGATTYLHDEAAKRLEQVQAEVGEANMPRSGGVGWPRSETSMGGKQSLKNLHNIGFAVDYNAYQAPMITDRRTLDMIAIVTGRSPSASYGEPKGFDTRKIGETYTSGSEEEKKKLDAEPKITSWLDGVEKEAEALGKASEDFRGSLKTTDKTGAVIDLGPQLQALRERWFKATTEDEKTKILAELQVVIKPWLDKVAAERKGQEAKITAAGFDLTKMPPADALKKATKNAEKLEKEMKKLQPKLGATLKKGQRAQVDKLITKASEQLGLAAPALADDPAAVAEFNRLFDLIGKWRTALTQKNWLDRVITLETALKSDAKFVFGAAMKKTVSDPSLAQIADIGFFNLAGKAKAGKEAFSPAFVKSMVKHGFNHGATWGTPDYMHFELRWKGPGM